jgi:hypothetical protein
MWLKGGGEERWARIYSPGVPPGKEGEGFEADSNRTKKEVGGGFADSALATGGRRVAGG